MAEVGSGREYSKSNAAWAAATRGIIVRRKSRPARRVAAGSGDGAAKDDCAAAPVRRDKRLRGGGR